MCFTFEKVRQHMETAVRPKFADFMREGVHNGGNGLLLRVLSRKNGVCEDCARDAVNTCLTSALFPPGSE